MASTDVAEVFAYQRTKTKDCVTIVTLKLTLDPTLFDRTADLRIIADHLIVPQGTFSLPGRNIDIRARILECTGGTFDTSGGEPLPKPAPKPPQPQTSPGPGLRGADGTPGVPAKPEDDGKRAGSASILAGEVRGSLRVTANGGAGRDGQDGGDAQPGGAGNDGPDDQISAEESDPSEGHPAPVEITRGAPGQTGGDGGKGGDSGKPGNGGAAGSLSLLTVAAYDKNLLTLENRAGPPGRPGTNGKGRPAGNGGELGGRIAEQQVVRSGPEGEALEWVLTDNRYPGGERGHDGTDGQILTANYGGSGSCSIESASERAKLLTSDDDVFGHLQLSMHQVEVWYLNAKYDDARALLTWISVTTPSSSDPKEKWSALNQRSRTLLGRLKRGLDYFGNVSNTIPLASYDTYRNALTTILASATAIEAVYNRYTDFLNAQKGTFADYTEAYGAAEGAIKQYKDAREQAVDSQLPVWDQALDLLAKLDAQRDIVLCAEESFKDAVTRRAPCATFLDILNLVGSIATCATDVYATFKSIGNIVSTVGELSAGKLLDSDKDGGGLGILKVCREFVSISKDEQDIYGKWKSISQVNTVDTPDLAKLVQSEDDLDEELKPYMAMPEAQAYRAAVHDYVSIAKARNDKLEEYAKLQEAVTLLEGKATQTEAHKDELKAKESDLFDPTLAPYRNFVLGLYQDCKAEILTQLYYETLAYRYWSLEDEPFAGSDNTMADLNSIHLRLTNDTLGHIGKVVSKDQTLQDFTHTFSDNKSDGRADQFNEFRKTGKFTFSLPIDDPSYIGWYGVRMTKFKITIPGAVTSADKNQLLAHLWHHGNANLLDAQGKRLVFAHGQVMSAYEYYIEKDSSGGQREVYKAGGELGDADGALSERIALSPFATWTIELLEKFNPGLDLSAVHTMTLSFSGFALPIPMRVA
jgi:hypothetical protein